MRDRVRQFAASSDRFLPFWFLLWSGWRLWELGFIRLGWEVSWLGRDFRIYRNAAVELLAGRDPWAALDVWNDTVWHFAALPITAQLFVPFAWLPEVVGLWIFLGATVLVMALGLRRLGLPQWWLLFPPMMEGLAATNPQIILTGLLLIGGAVAAPAFRAVAVSLKVYAIVPVVAGREWRAVLLTIAVAVASIAIAPGVWAEYVRQFGEISARINDEANGGVSAALFLDPKVFGSAVAALGALAVVPGLLLYGLVAGLVLLVAVRDVRAAGWLAVPLLWPASQYHYATFALPVARRASIWVISIATLPTYLLGLILLAYEVTAGRRAMVDEPPPVSLRAWLASLLPGGRLRAPEERRPRSPERPPAGTDPPSAS